MTADGLNEFEGPEPEATTISQHEWKNAGQMYLRCEDRSEAAKELVDGILADLPNRVRRPTSQARRRKALAAMLADLLKLHGEGLIGSHGMGREHFPSKGLGFGADVFHALKNDMVAAGLLCFQSGAPRWLTAMPMDGGTGIVHKSGGWVARFKLTPLAHAWVISVGLHPDAHDWADHWGQSERPQGVPQPLAAAPSLIGLRASSARQGGSKTKGAELPVDPTHPTVAAMIADLAAHNEFLAATGVQGVDFIGLRRLFNEGERSDRLWRSGGRFYSIRLNGMDRPYENMSARERLKRIRLGGRTTGEADMSASQLRLFYALLAVDLPDGLQADPYDIPGFDREPVKLVIAQALGKAHARSTRWSQGEPARDYEKRHVGRSLSKDFHFATYQAAALDAHPILRRLGQPDVPDALALQYVESEVVRLAMATLRTDGIASLPVHDSLIVDFDHLADAQQALQEAFKCQIEIMTGHPTKHTAKVRFKTLSAPSFASPALQHTETKSPPLD